MEERSKVRVDSELDDWSSVSVDAMKLMRKFERGGEMQKPIPTPTVRGGGLVVSWGSYFGRPKTTKGGNKQKG